MPIQNDLNGHFSYRLFNEKLFDLYKIIENINHTDSFDPDPSYPGALWLDGDNLKYAADNDWHSLYKNKFQLTEFIVSASQPENPVLGQLWIDRGIIKYYDGSGFTVLKADSIPSSTNTFDYYNYILIHSLKEYGENYIGNTANSIYFSKNIYKDDWQATSINNIYFYTILQTEHQLKNNFAYLLTTDTQIESGKYYKHALDDTDFQITTDDSGNIIIYINDPKDIVVNLIGTQTNSISSASIKTKTYLVPNAIYDRAFLDGIETENHNYINDVTMTIPSEIVGDKNVSVAHVDPKYLCDIKKCLILVGKDQPYINIKPEINNTYSEYYIYNVNTNRLELLVKYEGKPDYIETPNGIMLTKNALAKYLSTDHTQSFVVVFTFCFKAFKTKGIASKYSNIISDIDSGITLSTDIAYDNSYLIVDSDYNPDYSIENNKLKIDSFSGKHSVKLIKCSKKTHLIDIPHNADNIIVLESTAFDGFTKPYICFDNRIYDASSFLDSDGSYKIEIDYHTIPYLDIIDVNNTFFDSGIIENNCLEYTYEDIGTGKDYYLIIDNKIYSSTDVIRNKTNGSLYSQYIKNGLTYTIMLDNNSFIISDIISSRSINVDNTDDMIVYVNGEPVFNSVSVNLSSTKYDNQILYDGTNYYIKNNDDSTINISDDNINEAINRILNSYTKNDSLLEFDNSYVGQEYSIYAYTYGNAIEKPIITGEIDGSAGSADGIYYLNGSDQYSPGTNSLYIYINGIRQYPDTLTELNTISFQLEKPTDSIITYVIEPIENTETKSCQYNIIDNTNRLLAYKKTYTTDNILADGYIKVYKNGVRLIDSDFEIKSPDTIYINNADDNDRFLIEVRKDYTLRENTLPIIYDNTKWSTESKYTSELGTSYLPEEFITNHDTVLVYINGLLLGDKSCYEIDKINNTIELCDEANDLLNPLEKDNGYVTFEWR